MKVTTENFSGIAVDINIDPHGRFNADVPGYEANPLQGQSIEELRGQIRKAIVKMKAAVAVPITIWDITRDRPGRHGWRRGRGLLHCTLRGVHARSDALLLRADDTAGETYQIEDYHLRQNVGRRFTPEEIAQYAKLTAAVDEAQARLTALLEGVRIDPARAAAIVGAVEEV